MTSLQLGLFAAGAVLVAGVLVYNWLQERRVRRRIREAFSPNDARVDAASEGGLSTSTGPRIEPSLPPTRVTGAGPESRVQLPAGIVEKPAFERTYTVADGTFTPVP